MDVSSKMLSVSLKPPKDHLPTTSMLILMIKLRTRMRIEAGAVTFAERFKLSL